MSWIHTALETSLFFKNLWDDLNELWLFYYSKKVFQMIQNVYYGRIQQPCWDLGRVYNVSQHQHDMPVYIQRMEMGMLVWTLPTFLNNDHFVREKMTPCFISIRYISNSGVELDIDLEREFYITGNEVLSSGFVEWWIKTRYGSRWCNYSPKEPYRIVLMDTHLNTLEIGPTDVIVLNRRGFAGGLPYKKFHYRMMNALEYAD